MTERNRQLGILVLVTLVVLALAPLGTAFGRDFGGMAISKVELRTKDGATLGTRSDLEGIIDLKVGSRFSLDMIDRAIKDLYESARVDDVRVFAEPTGDGLVVVFELRLRDKVGEFGFRGNEHFSTQRLARSADLKVGGHVTDEAILSARKRIEDLYRSAGFWNVSVGHQLEEGGEAGSSKLWFIIEEGGRARVSGITFGGNAAFSNDELLRVSALDGRKWVSPVESELVRGEDWEQSMGMVLDHYRQHGYLRVQIDGVSVTSMDSGTVKVTVNLHEGDRYVVRSVDFVEGLAVHRDELAPSLLLRTGDPYSSTKMRRDLNAIRWEYGRRGYADATVTPDLRDAGVGLISIVYRVTEGTSYRVGRVNVEGNTRTRDEVIRREITLAPGEPFNSVELDRTEEKLERLGLFSAIQVDGVSSGIPGYRDVEILVEEGPLTSLDLKGGWSSLDGRILDGRIEQPNFDLRDPFVGGGLKLTGKWRLDSEGLDFEVALQAKHFGGNEIRIPPELED